jgi:hypothetical protein
MRFRGFSLGILGFRVAGRIVSGISFATHHTRNVPTLRGQSASRTAEPIKATCGEATLLEVQHGSEVLCYG